jgi:DNA polymerase III delta prime subunit
MDNIREVQKEIENNVRNHCKYVFNDPQTKIKDTCSIHDCHCVAIDSPYSFIETGQSICKIYNEFNVEKRDVRNSKKKICEKCGKTYLPKSNRQKFCSSCAAVMAKKSTRERQQKFKKNKLDSYSEIMSEK